MGYTDTLLASGERIVLRARQHWFMLAWNSRWAILAILLALALLVLRAASSGTSNALDVLGYVTLALFIGGLLVFAWNWVRYRNEEYLITTRRIVHAQGVVNKRATDSSLEKINDAVLSESIFGRMFGFGDLDVLTASESGIERLRMLRDAKSFKKAMLEAKHELEIELSRPTMPPLRQQEPPALAAPAPAPAPGPVEAMTADEVAAALGRLADMRDRGLITPEEFEAKRREVVARL